MKKSLQFIFLLCFAFTMSCSEENIPVTDFSCLEGISNFETNDCERGFDCTFDLEENATLKVEEMDNFTSVEIVDGTDLVFTYEKDKETDPNVADAGITETVRFVIPADSDEFSYADAELMNQNVVYTRTCFCGDAGTMRVTNGCVEGKKIKDGKWQIAIALEAMGEVGTYPVQVFAEFD